ncbi:hypothetical protein NB537_22195 [Vibrio parahaemolyticus]|nr:hypothetical protein [Vibrio parahaemolyticus]MCR9657478.1 hypothetical protein [Vibrio parahaemolyticus]
MTTIATNLASEHLLLNTANTNKITLLSNREIKFSSVDSRLIALSSHSELDKVVNYYHDSVGSVTHVVIDSQNHLNTATYVLQKNFFTTRLPVFDIKSKVTLCPKRRSTEYLLALYNLAPRQEYLQMIAKNLSHQFPLISMEPKEIVSKYIARDHLIFDELLIALKEEISKRKRAVDGHSSISRSFSSKHFTKLSSINLEQELQQCSTLAIKAATGTGKTKRLFGPLALHASEKERVVYVSHLIALVEQFCHDNKATSYSSNKLNEVENCEAFGVVINSIYKDMFLDKLASCHTLIIDEFEKVFKSVVCSDDNQQMQRNKVFDSLCYAIEKAPNVIVGDADLSDISLDFIQGLRGKLKVLHCTENPYTNIHAIVKDKATYLTSEISQRLWSDKAFLFDSVNTLKRTAKALGFVNDKNLYCEASALKQGVLILHGDNKGLDEQKELLSNPNLHIHKYRAVLVSPCLASGFSITSHFTNRVTVIADKTLCPRELINFARRFRSAQEIVFATNSNKEFITDDPTLVPKGQKWFQWSRLFKSRTKRLNSALDASLFFTLEQLGFITTVESHKPSELIDAMRHIHKESRAYFKSLVRAILKAENIQLSAISGALRNNLIISELEPAIIRSTIRQCYRLETLTEEDVHFHFQFDRRIFSLLPLVRSEGELKLDDEINQLDVDVARFLHSVLLLDDLFDDAKSKVFLNQDEMLSISEKVLSKREVLALVFDNDRLKRQKVDSQKKATQFIRKILWSLGFKLGNFSPKTRRARVSLDPRASQYRCYIRQKLELPPTS